MTTPRPINYSVAAGIPFVDSFHDANGYRQSEGQIDPVDIARLNNASYPTNPAFARLVAEIDAVHTASYTYPEYSQHKNGGGSFTYSVFNRNGGGTTQLIILGWRSNYELEGTKRGLAALALANPDKRYVVVNFMGRGKSTPLPLSVSRQMARTHSYLPAGELLREGLDQTNVLADADVVDVLGESEGHRLALGAVAQGLRVRNATLIDGPGMNGHSFRRLTRGLRKENAVHGPAFASASDDAWSQALHQQYGRARVLRHTISGLKSIRRNLGTFLLHPYAMSGFGLRYDTAAALANISQRMTVISPEASEITEYDDVEYSLETMAAVPAAIRPTLLHHRVAKGITHTVPGPGARALLYTQEPPPQRACRLQPRPVKCGQAPRFYPLNMLELPLLHMHP